MINNKNLCKLNQKKRYKILIQINKSRGDWYIFSTINKNMNANKNKTTKLFKFSFIIFKTKWEKIK